MTPRAALWLTFPHAGEGQSVLAHKLAAEEAGLISDTEADEAELGNAYGEVHVVVPVRTQSWEGNGGFGKC